MAGNSRMNEQLVFIDKIQSVQLGRELSAPKKHPIGGRFLEFLYTRMQVVGDVVGVRPWEVRSS